MKKYPFLSLLLLIPMALSLLSPVSASGKEDLNLFCSYAVLLDAARFSTTWGPTSGPTPPASPRS